jgi:hypothetical protein
MQDPEDNKVTLNEIDLKVRENLESVFAKKLSEISPQLENLRGMQELESWYEKSGKQDNTLEGILEDIANETMKYLPQQYANLSIDVIKLNSKDKTPM